jgi:hypothetical protein
VAASTAQPPHRAFCFRPTILPASVRRSPRARCAIPRGHTLPLSSPAPWRPIAYILIDSPATGRIRKEFCGFPPARRKPRSTTADSALGRAGETGYTTSDSGAEWQRSIRRQAGRSAISIVRLPPQRAIIGQRHGRTKVRSNRSRARRCGSIRGSYASSAFDFDGTLTRIGAVGAGNGKCIG